MTGKARKVALIAILALAGNALAAGYTMANATDMMCGIESKCKTHDDCSSEAHQCVVCYPNPFGGPYCTTQN